MSHKNSSLILLFIFSLAACSHQPEVHPATTQAERASICQKARHDKDLFCNEPDGNNLTKENICWRALKKIRQYCD